MAERAWKSQPAEPEHTSAVIGRCKRANCQAKLEKVPPMEETSLLELNQDLPPGCRVAGTACLGNVQIDPNIRFLVSTVNRIKDEYSNLLTSCPLALTCPDYSFWILLV